MLRRLLSLFTLFFFLAACSPAAIRATRTPVRTPTPLHIPTTTPVPTAIPTPRSLDATVSIWHSWNETQTEALDQILRAYQGAYPTVRFNVTYVPVEILQERYRQAAYNGSGPTLLLGQADWGPTYEHERLIADLTPSVSAEFRQSLLPSAIGLGFYRQHWISLPYAMSGVVLYRNLSIMPQASPDFDTLVASSLAVTKGGVVGVDLERGLSFSGGHIYGLGGSLMDEACNPTFNNDAGLEWLTLLQNFKLAGPVELDTNRDLRLFKEGTAGMIVEGTWKRAELIQAIGPSNLAIDPWPTTASGSLAGFVWGESLYLNVNAVGDEAQAAERLMFYFFTPEVQALLAEVGFIPSVTNAQPRDTLTQQAMISLAAGAAYPICPEMKVYGDSLTAMLYAVLEQGSDPATALQQAALEIETKLVEYHTSP